MTRIEITGKK